MRLLGLLAAILFLSGCPKPKKGEFEYPKPELSRALKQTCKTLRGQGNVFSLLRQYQSKSEAILAQLKEPTLETDVDALEARTRELIRLGEEIKAKSDPDWSVPRWELTALWRINRADFQDTLFWEFPKALSLRGGRVDHFYLNGDDAPAFLKLVKVSLEGEGKMQSVAFRLKKKFSSLEACELVSAATLGVTVGYRSMGRDLVREFHLGVPVLSMTP